MIIKLGVDTLIFGGTGIFIALVCSILGRTMSGFSGRERPFFRFWFLRRMAPPIVALCLVIGIIFDTVAM